VIATDESTRVRARAAVLLREGNSHQVELSQLADDLVWERLRAVELLRHRGYLALCEFANGAPQQLMMG